MMARFACFVIPSQPQRVINRCINTSATAHAQILGVYMLFLTQQIAKVTTQTVYQPGLFLCLLLFCNTFF
jgi:hypothetical protein